MNTFRSPYEWIIGFSRICLLLGMLWLGTPLIHAQVVTSHYVREPGTCTNTILQSPFTNWDMAATNIQDALNATASNDWVWVSNGTYYLSAQLVVTNAVTLISANGITSTVINGNRTVRCLYVSNDSALVSGLLITNGLNTNDGYGGGVFLRKGVVSNCWITGNLVSNPVTTASIGGGGIYVYKASWVKSCRVYGNRFHDTANSSENGGGGVYIFQEACVTDTVVMLNTYINAIYGDGGGGGVKMSCGGTKPLVNCQIISNSTLQSSGTLNGGGVHVSWGGVVKDSVISGNTNSSTGGGGITLRYGGELRNCLVCSNGAGGAGGASAVSATGAPIIQNCTIAGNRGKGPAVRLEEGPSASYRPLIMANSVIYSNFGAGDVVSNWSIASNTTNICLTNNCTYPTNFPANNITSGNISNNPQFIDCPAGNYRLRQDSPCINAGTNQSWMITSFDLDGRTRIRYGTVDMGVYENISKGAIYGSR